MSSLYVYAVVDRGHPEPSDLTGVGGAPLRLVTGDRIAAAVSDAPEPLVGRRRDLLAHSEAVQALWQAGPVLPMRFGTVAPDEPSLRADVLDDPDGTLAERLHALAHRAEMTLKAWHVEDTVLREVLAERRDVAALRARLKGGGAYSEQVRLGELVAGAVEGKQEQDADRLLDRLGPLALEVRPGPPVDGTLLNAAFLVAEDRLEEFRAAVDEISDRESERLRLRVAGPLPPYSFVDPAAETSPSGAGPRRRRARLDGASDLDGARSRSRGGTR